MNQKLIMQASVLILLFSFSFANARAEEKETKQRIVKSGKTLYDFEEVDIMGQLKKPEGQSIVEAPENRFKRLLDLDESFVPNIVRSVDEF